MTAGAGQQPAAGSASDRPARAWLLVAGTLAVVALAGARIDPASIDWEPGRAAPQPWRAWTAVGVHYSALHLAANLVGLLLTAALGAVADAPPRAAAAWLVAWPLTQFGLLATPQLARFGGLSGALHAGVVVVAIVLLVQRAGRARAIGAAVLLGCVAKVVAETPWAPPWLRHPAGWDIATAPIAHLTGCIAGAVCGVVACSPRLSRGSRPHG